MNSIQKVTDAGICTGCEHITFAINELGFPAPVVDKDCINCGDCLQKCIYWDDEY